MSLVCIEGVGSTGAQSLFPCLPLNLNLAWVRLNYYTYCSEKNIKIARYALPLTFDLVFLSNQGNRKSIHENANINHRGPQGWTLPWNRKLLSFNKYRVFFPFFLARKDIERLETQRNRMPHPDGGPSLFPGQNSFGGGSAQSNENSFLGDLMSNKKRKPTSRCGH